MWRVTSKSWLDFGGDPAVHVTLGLAEVAA